MNAYSPPPTFREWIINEAYRCLKDNDPIDGHIPEWAIWEAEKIFEREERAARRGSSDAKKAFRSSIGWKRTRYAVLADNCAKYGRLTCELCKSIEGPFHVDHRQPVSKRWDLRFERSNLVTLCAACNVGKMAGPDWQRPSEEQGNEIK